MQAGTAGVRRREGCAMSQQLGAWLRAWRWDRGWDVPEMARQLVKAAGGDRDALPAMDSLVAYVRRWERSGCGISERYMLLYCAALGLALSEFGSGDGAARQAALSGTAAGHHAVGYAALRATTFITEPAGTDFAVVPAATGAQDGGQSAGTLTDVLKAWDELMQRRAFLRGAGAAGMLALTPYHPAELRSEE